MSATITAATNCKCSLSDSVINVPVVYTVFYSRCHNCSMVLLVSQIFYDLRKFDKMMF